MHSPMLSFDSNGVSFSHEGITIRQGLFRHWMDIAISHAIDANNANAEARDFCNIDEFEKMGVALKREFKASMQCIIASAISLDAFHSAVKERIDIPSELLELWRSPENRTAYWKQMAEAFRLGFKLNSESVSAIRKYLREISKYRNWAIHPPSKSNKLVRRNDLMIDTEWRFVAFRCDNALTIVQMSLIIVWGLVKLLDRCNEHLKTYCIEEKKAIIPIISEWLSNFPEHSPLSEDDNNTQFN